MSVLAIETATKQLGVAIFDGGRILSSYELLEDYPHAVELPGAVTRVLKAARTSLEQLDAIVIDIGPGSFTGLRIGLAFAKALAFPSKKPLVSVPSLDVLAANVPYAARAICPILDAKQKNLYAARYHIKDGQTVKHTDYLLGPVDDILAQLTEPAVFLGDGCAPYRDRILARCPTAEFAPQELWLPRATTLARLGAERFRAGQRNDSSTLVPLYLYPLDCSVRSADRPTSVLPSKIVHASSAPSQSL